MNRKEDKFGEHSEGVIFLTNKLHVATIFRYPNVTSEGMLTDHVTPCAKLHGDDIEPLK